MCAAPDEAPAWARQWTKCFSCGKRWDLAGSAPREEVDEDENEEETDTRSAEFVADDLVALVMQVARGAPAEQKLERIMAKCTKNNCPSDAAADSVRCPKHRDMQRVQNAQYKGRALPPGGKRRKYTRRIPLGGIGGTVSTAGATMPATRTAPITMAEPTIVNGSQGRRMDLDGEEVSVLDSFIGKLEVDLQILHAAKEVMERHG